MNPILRNVLSCLKGVKRCGNGWKAFCPSHDDQKQSLHISEGKDGRVLVHCHAGCSVNDVCAAMGLELKDLYPEPERKRGRKSLSPGEIIATYDYRDGDGRLLFQVCRTADKRFFQRRPDAKGGWLSGLGNVKPVLYRLPELLQAVQRGETVFIPEGEKDADNLARLGLAATTNPMGAGKWRAEYSEFLRGAKVVILPDDDDPGRNHAQQVARALSGVAAEVKVLELPNLPPKGDVSDWLAEGGTKEELLRLAAGASRWEPEEPGETKVRPELKFGKSWFHPNGKEIRTYLKAILPRAIMPGGQILAEENIILTDPESIETFIAKMTSRYEALVPEGKRMQEGLIDEEWVRQELKRRLALLAGDDAGNDRVSEDKRETGPLAGTPYTVQNGCMCWRKPTRDGEITLPLCNFTAQVVRDVTRDDGAEEVRIFEIEGRLSSGKPLPRITVPAEKFYAMSWVANWGVDAVVSAGMGARDRLREAIQLASKGAVQERTYTHIGWRRIDSRWVYLHAGGAVGAEGVLVDPETESLRRYVLPADGSPEEGMKASLRLLEVAPLEITLPLWAAVWRAPIACLLFPTVVLWLHGDTGSFKSTLSALFLSHFGGPFTKDSLPASWLATDNALERLCFLARDTMLVIDDYAPEQHPREAAALDKRVNRLVRQVGNRSARGRLGGDLRTRPEMPPNALVVSTGEQLPLGVGSVVARILPVLCEREKVDMQKLTEAQAEAYLLPQTMRGYLKWLARRMDTLAQELPRRFGELRAQAIIEGHARLPEAVAHLYLGAELGLRYAVEIGVLDQVRREEIVREAWDVLLALAREHAKTLDEEKPALKFLQTLDAIFAQGKGHLVDRTTGERPPMAERFGWTYFESEDGQGGYRRGGDLLGWADAEGLYLIPEAAWRAVSEYLRASGGFPVRERTLREMLAREGVLIKNEDGRTTRSLRMEGAKHRVVHLDMNTYLSLLQKAVPPVPETANPSTTRLSAEPLTGSIPVPPPEKTVPAFGGGTALEPGGTAAEPLGGSGENLGPQGFERGGTAGTACGEREGWEEF